MKIALVTETYPPEVNGVAMTLHRIVTGLRKRGHETMVVRPSRTSLLPGSSAEEVLVRGLPLPGYAGLHFGLPCGSVLRKSWNAWRPDLVHVATEGPLGWSAARTARVMKIPLTTSFHTNFHAYMKHYKAGFLRKPAIRYLRSFHHRARATFVPTAEIKTDLERHSFSNMKIPSRGVDTDLFHPAKRNPGLRAQWGATPADPIVMTVSRMAAEKNVPLVARAFAAIHESLPTARLVFVGDGPELRRLRRIFPEHIYCGFQYGSALAAHYASADLFLFASETETFGNVITEAMASALPVVSYNYAAAELFLEDGRNGFVAELGVADQFVSRARDAAAAKSKWMEIGNAARLTALGIPWEKVLDKFEDDLIRIAGEDASAAS